MTTGAWVWGGGTRSPARGRGSRSRVRDRSGNPTGGGAQGSEAERSAADEELQRIARPQRGHAQILFFSFSLFLLFLMVGDFGLAPVGGLYFTQNGLRPRPVPVVVAVGPWPWDFCYICGLLKQIISSFIDDKQDIDTYQDFTGIVFILPEWLCRP
jgi:hypothetical protein